jgi:mRNA interferase HigB
MGAEYAVEVRIISRGTLNGFVRNRVEARLQQDIQGQLDAWYALASRATWKNSGDLRQQQRSARIASAERAVFNIQGNEYMLAVALDYHHEVILVLWLGTHREYDQIDVKQVRYDKGRYADPTSSYRGGA